MDHHKQIIAFLSRPENLPITLEVSNYASAIREDLHLSFWNGIEKSLKNRLDKTAYGKRWFVNNIGGYNRGWAQYLIQGRTTPKTFYLSVSIEVANNPKEGYGIWCGLVWNKENRHPPMIESYKKLVELAVDAKIPEPGEDDFWWPNLLEIANYTNADDFLIHYSLDPNAYISNVINTTWILFKKVEPALYKFNQDMMRRKR